MLRASAKCGPGAWVPRAGPCTGHHRRCSSPSQQRRTESRRRWRAARSARVECRHRHPRLRAHPDRLARPGGRGSRPGTRSGAFRRVEVEGRGGSGCTHPADHRPEAPRAWRRGLTLERRGSPTPRHPECVGMRARRPRTASCSAGATLLARRQSLRQDSRFAILVLFSRPLDPRREGVTPSEVEFTVTGGTLTWRFEKPRHGAEVAAGSVEP